MHDIWISKLASHYCVLCTYYLECTYISFFRNNKNVRLATSVTICEKIIIYTNSKYKSDFYKKKNNNNKFYGKKYEEFKVFGGAHSYSYERYVHSELIITFCEIACRAVGYKYVQNIFSSFFFGFTRTFMPSM